MVEDVKTRRLRVGLLRAAWRMESVPAMAGSIIAFEGGKPDNGSVGRGCTPIGVLEVEYSQDRCVFAFRNPTVPSTNKGGGICW